MEKNELLAGSEIFEYLVSRGSGDLDHVIEAAESMSEEVEPADIRQSLQFAACLVGFYREVFPLFEQTGLYILFSTERKKSAIAGYMSGGTDGYIIFANGFGNEIGKRLREMVDYDHIVTEEALMVGLAMRQLRYHLLCKRKVKPIKKDDYLKVRDPLLKETIKLYGAKMEQLGKSVTEKTDSERLEWEFDTTVIEAVALHRLEWGMSIEELVSLALTEVQAQQRQI